MLNFTPDDLRALGATLATEIPISSAIGLTVVDFDRDVLTLAAPLAPNMNHKDTAFAGSLNALCTVVGWGTVFLMLERQGLAGNVVIRRGSIRYLRPVHDERIVCRGRPVDAEAEQFFFELLGSKGQSKIDVETEIADADGALGLLGVESGALLYPRDEVLHALAAPFGGYLMPCLHRLGNYSRLAARRSIGRGF